MGRLDQREHRAFESVESVESVDGVRLEALTQPLGLMRPGSAGRILAVQCGDDKRDIERGLLEMGLVEGARVEVLHCGFWGGDPLAVRINQSMTVALRRCEANAVLIGPVQDQDVQVVPALRASMEYAL